MYVYAVQYDIFPRGGEAATELVDALQSDVLRWVARKYPGSGLDAPMDSSGTWDLGRDHRAVLNRNVEDRAALVEATWVHPDPDDETVLRNAYCRIARVDKKVQMAFTLDVSSPHFHVRPFRYRLKSPQLARTLLARYDCRTGRRPVSYAPRILRPADMPAVARDLESPSRCLPFFVFTLLPGNVPPLDVADFQEHVPGLAECGVLDSEGTTYALREAVGNSLVAFGGGARLNWPGLSLSDGTWSHPLYLVEQLREVQPGDRTFADRMFLSLANASALRFREGPVIQQARALLAEHRRHAMENMKSRLRTQKDRDAWEEWDAAVQENDHLREQIQSLKEENARLSQALRGHPVVMEDATREDTAAQEDMEPRIRTLADALRAAERDADGVLRIYESAWDSANASQSRWADLTYTALMEIASLAKDYFHPETAGAIGQWHRRFKDAGFKYSGRESVTTMSLFGAQRCFADGNHHRTIEQHLTFGQNNTTDCTQIYFDLDRDNKRMDIGYCGSHLKTSKRC